MSMFQESVEKKIDDPRGKLTRLIKYTRGEPRELVKHFINDRADRGYKNAIALLQKQYGNRHTVVIIQEGDQTYATFKTWRCCNISEIVQFPDQMPDNRSW